MLQTTHHLHHFSTYFNDVGEIAVKETVRTRLIEERKRQRWSQQEVANRLGTTRNNVSRWEQGLTTPGPYFRVKISELFGKSMETLGLFPDNEAQSDGERTETDVPAGMSSAPDGGTHQGDTIEKSATTVATTQRKKQGNLSSLSTPGAPAAASPAHSSHSRRFRFLLLLGVIIVLGISLGGIYASNILFRKNTKAPLTAQQALNASIEAALRTNTNPYGPAQSQLVFDDPLQQNIPMNNWQVNAPLPSPPYGQQRCFFKDQAYDLLANGANDCDEYTSSFTNMVYQIEFSQLQGQSAGIIFHATDDSNFYYFHLDISGGYLLDLVTTQTVKILAVGSCSYVFRGQHQWNLLAVKEVGATIELYINTHKVAEISDNTHSRGYIGVGVGAYRDTIMNEALFRYARVWQL
jgi:transcriptional regulator with XRE-family HTH domain